MSPHRVQAAVVVGVNDAGSAGAAVDWAAAEAATRGCPLRIVHALQPRLPSAYPFLPPLDDPDAARAAAVGLLRRAADRARGIEPDMEVSARLRWGSPARVLRTEAVRAALVVLGRRGEHRSRGLRTGSISAAVATHACCPLVVISSPRPIRRTGDFAGSPPRVVVGIDAAGTCTSAIDFALRAARQRGVGLTAVHAWAQGPQAGPGARSTSPTCGEMLARHAVERALAPWRPAFGDITITTTLVRDDPAAALTTESAGAALLVVGSRGRGRLRAALQGSVSQTVLTHARSPVAVVRPDTAASQPGQRLAKGSALDAEPPPSGPHPGPARTRDAPKGRRWPV